MPMTANFLTKLHIAGLEARNSLGQGSGLTLYPVVDGLYVTCPKQDSVLTLIKRMMRMLALSFIFETEAFKHFMVRGGLAYGPVWEGSALMTEKHYALRNNPDHAQHILLGPSVTQAHESESNASPFGVWVHESARTFRPAESPHAITTTHWHWWKYKADDVDDILVPTLRDHIKAYLGWCKRNSTYILYRDDRIEAHTRLATQYFTLHTLPDTQ